MHKVKTKVNYCNSAVGQMIKKITVHRKKKIKKKIQIDKLGIINVCSLYYRCMLLRKACV